jgi:tetratricopeptide (TPR) repeat protein
VPVPEEPKEVVAVESDEDGDVVEVEEESGPVTVGDLAEGTKAVVDSIGTHARRLIDRGRYRKIRISRKGKQVLPDIPIAAAAALEAASMYGAGIARVLAVNVGARFLFDVEIVNEADKYFERGKQALLDGDLDRAREALEKAVRIDDTHPGAFLQLGVMYRLKGEAEKARVMLLRARELDENGDVGRRAEEIIRALDTPPSDD